MTSRRRRPAVLALVASALLVTACGKDKPAAGPSTSPTASPSATPTSDRGPLSGLAGKAGAPVLVVKVENTAAGRPQAGLNAADVVYLEQVEGGLTRLAAVFSSRFPDQVGPVRSARETDVELLGSYGKVALAYSGVNRKVRPILAGSSLVNASYDVIPRLYTLVGSRPRPYNFFIDPAKVVAAKHGDPATDIGLRFGALPKGASAATKLSAQVASVSTQFSYDASTKKWRLAYDGAPISLTDGKRVVADNVIVQFVSVHPSRFHDVRGNNTPYSETIGKGRAVLFRDGKRVEGTWSRSSLRAPTVYRTKSGARMTLRTGTTWVLLPTKGASLTSS